MEKSEKKSWVSGEDIEKLESILREGTPKESDKSDNSSIGEPQKLSEQSNDINLSSYFSKTLEGLEKIPSPEQQRKPIETQTTLCKMVDEMIKPREQEDQKHQHPGITSQINLSEYVKKNYMAETLEDIFKKLGKVFKISRKISNNELGIYIYNEIKGILKLIAQEYRKLTGNYGKLKEYLGVRRNVSRKK